MRFTPGSAALLLFIQEFEDLAQARIDEIEQEEIIRKAAYIIARLPNRQRTAILQDLAKRSLFDEAPTLLEQTLSGEGISLRDFLRIGQVDRQEKRRHVANLCIAYKRLKKEMEK
jgi:hypothetical protein